MKKSRDVNEKDFESKPIYGYDDKYIKTKTKTCGHYNYKFS